MGSISRATCSTAALGLLVALSLATTANAADPVEHDHSHKASQSSSPAADATATAAMNDMQAMHRKMMAAKTSAERQALTLDHMQAMREGMAAMQRMSSGDKAGSPKALQQRMDMMTMMMQMMMDREQVTDGMDMGGAMMSRPTHAPAESPTSDTSKPQ